jgi:hypothetical protein
MKVRVPEGCLYAKDIQHLHAGVTHVAPLFALGAVLPRHAALHVHPLVGPVRAHVALVEQRDHLYMSGGRGEGAVTIARINLRCTA